MLEAFFKEWGAWAVSVLSLGVAALAYVNSRKAVSVTAKEHEWKAKDRDDEEARRQWCAAKAEALAVQSMGAFGWEPDLYIEIEQIPWAKWGEAQGFFTLAADDNGRPCVRPRRG